MRRTTAMSGIINMQLHATVVKANICQEKYYLMALKTFIHLQKVHTTTQKREGKQKLENTYAHMSAFFYGSVLMQLYLLWHVK